MAHVIEINEIQDLEPYRMAWNALLPGTPNASFFHTYDWLEAYWRHFGADQKLRILVVLSCGKPIGIVPLCVRRDRFRVGALRVLTYPLDDWGTWFGPIGGNTAATTLMAMHHLANRRMIGTCWSSAGTTGREAIAAGRSAQSRPWDSNPGRRLIKKRRSSTPPGSGTHIGHRAGPMAQQRSPG